MALSPPRERAAPKKRTARKRMTLQEFLTRPSEEYSEWVDGEVIYLSVTLGHQRIVQFLFLLMEYLTQEHDLGTVLIAPCALKLANRPSGREPGIMFIAKENAHRILEKYVEGPVDVVVEVVGDDSRTRDRRDKFFEYAQGGVREYWMLDYERQRPEFYRLQPDGTYDPVPLEEGGIFRSEALPGFWLKVEWLWQKPLPKLMDVLKAWQLVSEEKPGKEAHNA
jgi:Uma2 family endonuclease